MPGTFLNGFALAILVVNFASQFTSNPLIAFQHDGRCLAAAPVYKPQLSTQCLANKVCSIPLLHDPILGTGLALVAD